MGREGQSPASGFNLAPGPALESIGLIISTVVAIAIFFNLPLSLGISDLNIVLMYLSFFIVAFLTPLRTLTTDLLDNF